MRQTTAPRVEDGRNKEFAAKLGIVSEEADESVFWLQRISNADIKSTIATSPLLSEAEELARIFCASARTARGAVAAAPTELTFSNHILKLQFAH